MEEASVIVAIGCVAVAGLAALSLPVLYRIQDGHWFWRPVKPLKAKHSYQYRGLNRDLTPEEAEHFARLCFDEDAERQHQQNLHNTSLIMDAQRRIKKEKDGGL